MNEPQNGGPAFPMSGDPGVEFDRGMSLLDYFAGQVACGDAAAGDGWIMTGNIPREALAKRAEFYYAVAAAMLEARKPKSKP